MPNPTFGLIAEGPTDQRVLKNILIGFFNDPDLTVRFLQPLLDATDVSQRQGGWTQVLAYCQSSRLQEAFGQNEYLVVQIDTDRLFEQPFNLDLNQPVETLVSQVIEKIEESMRGAFEKDFLEKYRSKILFAVAVNEIECWLLPLYYQDQTSIGMRGCLGKLNDKLRKEKEHIVNPDNKVPQRYDQLSRPLLKHKTFLITAEKNPSFQIFFGKLKKTFSES